MDKKVIKLDTKTSAQEKENGKQMFSRSFFNTNPILQKMLNTNLTEKKGKFSLKDLFR